MTRTEGVRPLCGWHPADISRVRSESSGEKFGGKISITQWDLLQMSMCPSRRHYSVAAKLSGDVKIEGFLITMNIWCENRFCSTTRNLFLCHPFSQLKHPRFSITKTDSGLFHPQTPWTLKIVCCIRALGPWRNSSPSAPHCMLMYEYLRGPAQHYATLEHN